MLLLLALFPSLVVYKGALITVLLLRLEMPRHVIQVLELIFSLMEQFRQ